MELSAYLFVETSIGKSLEVAGALKHHVWVKSVERLVGPYDVMAVVTGASDADLGARVKEALGRIDGVLRTAICPVFA